VGLRHELLHPLGVVVEAPEDVLPVVQALQDLLGVALDLHQRPDEWRPEIDGGTRVSSTFEAADSQ
jgi:hypothetical protein